MSQQDEAAFFVRSFGCALFNEVGTMKIGLRTPSLKKSFKARTTGRLKRKIKKATNPFHGKKGMGYIKNPKRAIKIKSTTKQPLVGITQMHGFIFYCFLQQQALVTLYI